MATQLINPLRWPSVQNQSLDFKWTWTDLAFGVCGGTSYTNVFKSLNIRLTAFKNHPSSYLGTSLLTTYHIYSLYNKTIKLAPKISFIAENQKAIKLAACIWGLMNLYFMRQYSKSLRNEEDFPLLSAKTPHLVLAGNIGLTILDWSPTTRPEIVFNLGTVAISLADQSNKLHSYISWVWDKFYYPMGAIAFSQGDKARKLQVIQGLAIKFMQIKPVAEWINRQLFRWNNFLKTIED